MHQFVLLMELIKKSQQTVQRMGKRKTISSDFETVWQDRFGLQLWSLTFPSLIFLASLFWPHISPPTHIYLHFANFSLSKISKSFVAINLCVNICTHCQSWDWLLHLILQGRSWIKHRIRDLCNEKHHFQSKVKYTNSECLEITLRYWYALMSFLPGCDFVFPGIFYCDVAHNKRAIKSVLVFLLGDDLWMWISWKWKWRKYWFSAKWTIVKGMI